MNSTMQTQIPNARFWVWVNGGDVKLTLRPKQSLTHQTGGPCDEGYHYEGNTWLHAGDRVTRSGGSWSRDCDGPHSTWDEYECSLDDLKSFQPKNSDGSPWGPLKPTWERLGSGQRDYFAEAMGY